MSDRPLLSFAAAAALLSVHEVTLRRWYHRGSLPPAMVVRPDGRYWLRRRVVLAWRDGLDTGTPTLAVLRSEVAG